MNNEATISGTVCRVSICYHQEICLIGLSKTYSYSFPTNPGKGQAIFSRGAIFKSLQAWGSSWEGNNRSNKLSPQIEDLIKLLAIHNKDLNSAGGNIKLDSNMN